MIQINKNAQQYVRHKTEAGGGEAVCSRLPAGVSAHSMTPATPAGPAITISDDAKRRIIRDTECLATVCAGPDVPGGVAIVETHGDMGPSGFAIGSGHRLAAALNVRAEIAIAINVDRLIEFSLYKAHCAACAIETVVIGAASTAIHELAHCLVSPLDSASNLNSVSASTLQEFVRGDVRFESSPLSSLKSHGVAWSAANVILTKRATDLRSERMRFFLEKGLETESMLYSLPDCYEIAAAVEDVPKNAPLRPLLADEKWLARIPSLPMAHRLERARRGYPTSLWRTEDDRECD